MQIFSTLMFFKLELIIDFFFCLLFFTYLLAIMNGNYFHCLFELAVQVIGESSKLF